MIIAEITLHSANTGKASNLGKIYIANDGSGTKTHGNYNVRLYQRNSERVWKRAKVFDFPRKKLGAYDLIFRALKACGIQSRNS